MAVGYRASSNHYVCYHPARSRTTVSYSILNVLLQVILHVMVLLDQVFWRNCNL
jgi:hypothetical protein